MGVGIKAFVELLFSLPSLGVGFKSHRAQSLGLRLEG